MDEQHRHLVDRHFVANLTQQEYVALRVEVARQGTTLKVWITNTIREKLKRIKEEQ